MWKPKNEREMGYLRGKPVVAILPCGTEEYYPSLCAAARAITGKNQIANISNAAKGRTKSAYKRKWKFYDWRN